MSGTKRLRYTGEVATSFRDHGIGLVEPGGVFEVPAQDAERFTRRSDIEEAPASGAGKRRRPAGDSDSTGPAGETLE